MDPVTAVCSLERQEECRALAADARRRLGEVKTLVRTRERAAKVSACVVFVFLGGTCKYEDVLCTEMHGKFEFFLNI